MGEVPYTPPSYGETAFNCPHCNAFAKQTWHQVALYRSVYQMLDQWRATVCDRCDRIMLWWGERAIYPAMSLAPLPSADLPEDVRLDFLEARDILERSPRGAGALLRLAVQKLCIALGEPGKNLNDDIGALVKKGLPVQVQQALDVSRVIGNNAVHPGEIDLSDDRARVLAVFGLINRIADRMITDPRELSELYGSLPQGVLEAIEKRDGG